MATKVLVTGVTGRVGANLAKTLLERGYEVRGLVMPSDPKEEKLKALDVEIVYGDLSDQASLQSAVKSVQIVVDLAAIIGCPAGMEIATYFDIMVGGKFKLMEAIAADGHVRRIVHISSVAAYSSLNALYTPTDEDHPLQPCDIYGIAKVIAEKTIWCQSQRHRIPTTVLRYGHVDCGEEALNCYTTGFIVGLLRSCGASVWSSIYVEGVKEPWKMIESVMENKNQLIIPRAPDGRTWLWKPCDVRDAIEGTILAMENPSALGEAFNIEGPRAVTWEEIVKYLAPKLGQSYIEVKIPNIWQFETTIGKAKRLPAYRPQYDGYRMVDSAIDMRAGKDIGVIPV